MMFDPTQLQASFAFDTEQVVELRAAWVQLLETAVWGDLKSTTIGALPRLRKRLLELGENLRSLVSDRNWIPHERERVKGAMAASLNLRDSLLQADRSAKLLTDGADFPGFEAAYLAFRQRVLTLIEIHENQWATLLESLYRDEPE